jgi:hypothetical protein
LIQLGLEIGSIVPCPRLLRSRSCTQKAALEGLCGGLERTVLMSQPFAELVSVPTVCLGAQALKGVEELAEIHGLAEIIASD